MQLYGLEFYAFLNLSNFDINDLRQDFHLKILQKQFKQFVAEQNNNDEIEWRSFYFLASRNDFCILIFKTLFIDPNTSMQKYFLMKFA